MRLRVQRTGVSRRLAGFESSPGLRNVSRLLRREGCLHGLGGRWTQHLARREVGEKCQELSEESHHARP